MNNERYFLNEKKGRKKERKKEGKIISRIFLDIKRNNENK